MVFTVDGRDYDAEPGAMIYVPRDVVHSYRTSARARRRRVVGPPLDPAEIAAMAGVADKYGFTFVQ